MPEDFQTVSLALAQMHADTRAALSNQSEADMDATEKHVWGKKTSQMPLKLSFVDLLVSHYKYNYSEMRRRLRVRWTAAKFPR